MSPNTEPVAPVAVRWSDSVRDWLSALRTPTRQPAVEHTVDQIKQLMLQTLDTPRDGRLTDDDRLRLRIRMCDDVLTLWYMRSELMQIFSARIGEQEASLQLTRISALFEGMLPAGLASQARQHNRTKQTVRS